MLPGSSAVLGGVGSPAPDDALGVHLSHARDVWRSGKLPTSPARALTTPRSAGLAGVVFAVLFGVSLVLLRTSLPRTRWQGPSCPPTATLRMKVALTLVPIAGIAFLWFVGVVRDRLGDVEDRFFATVYLGSGVLFLAMVFVSMASGRRHPDDRGSDVSHSSSRKSSPSAGP